MPIHELAGKPAPRSMLANIPRLVSAYCTHKPDVSDPGQRVAFGNDTDMDRHGIVTRTAGLLNPNHYQAVAIWYLFQNRPGWREDAAVGKTLVSSSMIDRVADYLKKRLCEVPVGFKMLNNYPVSWRLSCQTTFMS